MTPRIPLLTLTAALVFSGSTADAQGLKKGKADVSPPVDAFLAYEKALLDGGIEAAVPFMTAAKEADLRSMVQAFGEEGFKQFLDRMRAGAQGEARRKQIQKIDIVGDHAVLEARDGPNSVTVQYLAKTKNGWKVDIKR